MAVFHGHGFYDNVFINQKLSQIHLNLDTSNIITREDFAWLEQLVFKNNNTISSSNLMNALHVLGKCYLRQKEYANLHECIGYVSQLSDDEARYALMCMTEGGRSDNARLFFRSFVEQIGDGDINAFCSMGIFRYYGMYCAQDRDDAVKIFKTLARCSASASAHPILVAMLTKST